MIDYDPEEQYDLGEVDHEGTFDAQMSLPLPFVDAPEPFSTVIKRSGREEAFDRHKIANAIYQAAHSIGGTDQDLAESLARAVTIYLTKQLKSHVPTVDHIHDAVERVLIQMTHVRTAFAYARYRDRRARIRRLREGDMRLLLDELKEARREGEEFPVQGFSIRTSDDTLISWDRNRISEALVRETALDPSMAQIVAMEVEEQLKSAKIETLTTSLVRELVAARLIAHDLHEFRDRHRRLGVPIYDCERIIRGLTDATTGRDPVATDRILAGAVKKEYALTQIYAPHVSEAHVDGAIHLHDLDKPERLHQVTLSPAMVAAYGVGLPGTPDFASPPRNATTFLAQLAKATASFQACIAGAIHWDGINFHLAPYVREFGPDELRQFAQMMVYEFAYRALAHGGDGLDTELRFYWSAPAHLADTKVVGPEDVVPNCTYGDLEHTAQQLAWKFMDVIAAADGLPAVAPIAGICLDAQFFRAPGSEAFLARTTMLVEAGYPIRFHFHRSPIAESSVAPYAPIDTVFHRVSLNLPRLAYETGKEDHFMIALDKHLTLVASALGERYDFLEGLMARGTAGPLGLLAILREGKPTVDITMSHGYVSVCGTNEAVKVLMGCGLHEGDEARDLGLRIVARIAKKCDQESRKRNMRLVMIGENNPVVGRRFADLDAACYPKTIQTAVSDDKLSRLSYTDGVALSGEVDLSPFEALILEGEMHRYMDGASMSLVCLPSIGIAGESIASFIKKVHTHTQINGISFKQNKAK